MIRSTLEAFAAAAMIGIHSGGPGAGFYDGCGWQLVKHKKWNAGYTRKKVYVTKEYVCG